MLSDSEIWFNKIKRKQFNIVNHCNYDSIACKLTDLQMSVLQMIGNAESYKDLPNFFGRYIETLLLDIKKKM